MTDYHKGNVDAYHDGLLAKHLAEQDYDPPWSVVDYEGEGGGYIVVNEDDEEDKMGFVFDTEREAQRYADGLNKEEIYDDYDY
jgi:hypothetical protein